MRTYRALIIVAIFIFCSTCGFTQNRNNANSEYMKFVNNAREQYKNFLDKSNQEYAKMLSGEWNPFELQHTDTLPAEKEFVPQPVKENNSIEKVTSITRIADTNIVTDALFSFVRKKAEPQQEIEEMETFMFPSLLEFTFYGTKMEVRIPSEKIKDEPANEIQVARIWGKFKGEEYNNLLYDCLQLKKKHNLCDWGYLNMLNALANEYYPTSPNCATLIISYLYANSGYKIKLGITENRKNIYLLYTSYDLINGYYYAIDGKKYYIYTADQSAAEIKHTISERCYISQASMEHEYPLSFIIEKAPTLSYSSSDSINLKTSNFRFPTIDIKITTNRNLIEFYNSYPETQITSSKYIWTQYANTPLSAKTKEQLYPTLKKLVEGKDTATALRTVHSFMLDAFTYKLDNDVWGHNRIFFPEETLYYPFNDCEDRAILFSRIVRDILNMEVALLYYPNHLSTIVKVGNNFHYPGDYIILPDGTKYIVCDPTYNGSTIGETPDGLDNNTARIIFL